MNLFIISNVHVEPKSSAAGKRMLQLIEFFLARNFRITYGTTAGQSDRSIDYSAHNIELVSVSVNDPSFDELIKKANPDVVLFDRFMTEEQFGWRVSKFCPDALRILDTEDLHCLRYAREAAVNDGREFQKSDLVRDIAFREIASILRSDLSLIISAYEMELLTSFFKVPLSQLHYLPFLVDDHESIDTTPFEERKDFITVGNFRHAPNADSVKYLKERIWPRIHSALPEAKMHVYGAYEANKHLQWSDTDRNFLVHGWIDDLPASLHSSRVMLAPLRFGAGLKGKLLDAMLHGLPSVTTTVGAEAMHGELSWPGVIENNPDKFADAAIELYSNKEAWNGTISQIQPIINAVYPSKEHLKKLQVRVDELLEHLVDHRSEHFVGRMLQHHTLRSTEYMSRWIEEKGNR